MGKTAIIDCVLAVCLIAAAALGARRGLIRSVAGLAAVVIALVGANLAASALTPPVTAFLEPRVESYLTGRVAELTPPEVPESVPGGEEPQPRMEELLDALGFNGKFQSRVAESAENAARDTGASLMTALTRGILDSLVRAALFVLLFLALSLLLRLIVGALNLAAKLPGLRLLNSLGGALVGLAQGVLILALAAAALVWLGLLDPEEILPAGTSLFAVFATRPQ